MPKLQLPKIPESEKTPWVIKLLSFIGELFLGIEKLKAEIQQLKDEISDLKKHHKRPKISPSTLGKGKKPPGSSKGKRPGSAKKKKTAKLAIHKKVRIPPASIPSGAEFKGFHDYVVQGIKIEPYNICYSLERWKTPDGSYVTGQLPSEVQCHYSAELISFIQYQYYQCHVTQPLLLEALEEWGFAISSGELNHLLIENKTPFHEEKDRILQTALRESSYVQVDDTGARHQGQNGYCTQMGNPFFTWFESTDSKSRINFLERLRTGYQDYWLNEEAFEYMQSHKLPHYVLARLKENTGAPFENQEKWEAHLKQLQIIAPRHIQIATEGALFGSILSHGVPRNLVILSDDAGQFNVFEHALCWIHAERTLHKIIPYNKRDRKAFKKIRGRIWKFYEDLKIYQQAPNAVDKEKLERGFETIFTTKTDNATMNLALQRLHQNKKELLLVLKHPEIPLHNNLSENDIREYVKRRKISGSTRSPAGRRARDTFTSLKKTCRKLGLSFWQYLLARNRKDETLADLSQILLEQYKSSLHDHLSGKRQMPSLAQVIRETTSTPTSEELAQNDRLTQRSVPVPLKAVSANQTQTRVSFFAGIKKLPLQAVIAMEQKAGGVPSAIPSLDTS